MVALVFAFLHFSAGPPSVRNLRYSLLTKLFLFGLSIMEFWHTHIHTEFWNIDQTHRSAAGLVKNLFYDINIFIDWPGPRGSCGTIQPILAFLASRKQSACDIQAMLPTSKFIQTSGWSISAPGMSAFSGLQTGRPLNEHKCAAQCTVGCRRHWAAAQTRQWKHKCEAPITSSR
jgi:hypothetical protein